MKLMMFLGNDLIEAVSLNDSQLSEPGYIGSFKRMLKEKYHELIRQETADPEFLVINPEPATLQPQQSN